MIPAMHLCQPRDKADRYWCGPAQALQRLLMICVNLIVEQYQRRLIAFATRTYGSQGTFVIGDAFRL